MLLPFDFVIGEGKCVKYDKNKAETMKKAELHCKPIFAHTLESHVSVFPLITSTLLLFNKRSFNFLSSFFSKGIHTTCSSIITISSYI